MHSPSFIDDSSSSDLVIVSPHLDDAIFSLGGWLKHVSGNTKIQVINVFTRTGYVFQENRSVEIGSKIRKDEDAIALDAAGIDAIHNLDFPEALERGYEREDIFEEMGSDEMLSLRIKHRIEELLPRDAKILGPAAFGAHIDHIVVRDAVRTLPHTAYYADLPYAGRQKKRAAAEEFVKEKTSASIVPTQNMIDVHLRLCRLYASQIRDKQIGLMHDHLNGSGYQLWHGKNAGSYRA